MPKNAFDPDRLLDGFHAQLAASQRQIDLDTVLGGWKADPTGARLHRDADATPAPAAPTRGFKPAERPPLDSDITDVVDIGELRQTLDSARAAEADLAAELSAGLDSIGATASRAAAAAARPADDWTLPVLADRRRHRDRRLLLHWAPGAWIGAWKPVCAATTEFHNSPRGPVVETYPAQSLLALWAPAASNDSPMPGRWPTQVLLGASSPHDAISAAGEALLPLLPDGALLWLCDEAIDWALVADLVLHHEPTLRPFQMKALRGFADAERRADFERVNDGYAQIETGRPVQRR